MSLHIVLIEPEIHTNTGNIGRLSLATASQLHLVKPFGFELTDKRLKRAGLDYWQHIELTIYEDTEDFFEKNKNRKMVFLSSYGTKDYTEIPYQKDVMLVFGKESKGLPSTITERFKNDLYKIPQYSEHLRSINLANAVAVVTYEGLRQLRS
ncbi:tRNA (cytidine(34)-2'-O)-methyltransferase [Nonlabens sp.]|uniref:tRNA (cytidine(34)-2'-O)-methyltransferase n=1 Tax=Nonlabens sp. TaxID=1888209 RepID=UPI001BCB9BB0|nr:tRNA (cytidine(34)-2'-O)-methyltransferase [Nonlabens sp.]